MEDRFEVQRVVNSVRGKPTEYAVNYAILKSMTKAIYQPEEEMHYALQFDNYCHFTSPIRRYPDLQVHRTVHRLIEEQKPAGDPVPVLITLGHHCSDKEQNAEWAEREVIRIKLLHFLNKKIGEVMPGVISGVTPEGFFVRGTKFPAEGFVRVQSLPTDRYRFERRGQMLTGFRDGNSFRLGDTVTVKIAEVDLARRELILLLEGTTARRKAPGRKSDDRRPSGGKAYARKKTSGTKSESKKTGGKKPGKKPAKSSGGKKGGRAKSKKAKGGKKR
jgi:ribonuclease R